LRHNTTVAHLALTLLFAGCGHSSSQALDSEQSGYEQQSHGNRQVRSTGTADAVYDEPKYKIALSEVLEKAPTRNAAKYMRNAFDIGVSAGRLDSLPFEFRNANSYANMGCSGAAIRLLKVGKSLDLSSCQGLEDPRFREATIPGQGYADSRLAVVNQFRGDPDAVTFQLLAFERGYTAATTDVLRPTVRQIGSWIREGCGVALKLVAAENESAICPDLATEILRGMAEAKKGQAAQQGVAPDDRSPSAPARR
jgi:hypothetical protein